MKRNATEKMQKPEIIMHNNSIGSTVMPFYKTCTDLQNSYNEISALCHTHSAPVFITKDGQADLVIMSVEYYEQLIGSMELRGLLEGGMHDSVPIIKDL